ncbi:MAG: putative porin [Candidatus Acidiferrales bacterium]
MTVPLKKGTLVILAALLLAAPALAGENDSKTSPPRAASQPQLQQQLTEQQQRILELERLLKQQGLLLEALRQQLASMELPPAPMPSSAAVGAPAVQEPPVSQEIERISGELDAVAERNKELSQKVDDLDKKNAAGEKSLGDKVKGLGNFTFSGDVRVRYEPFFGGTQTEDRHRERFRVRFNANAKFSDEISGGLTIASGDLTDPISTNQSLTQFFERKTIAIDRAFIAYNPKWYNPLTLTGGKFGYTWYRTEHIFDNDLNPEGFSQAFSWKINNPVLQRITLVVAELPFNERSNNDDSWLYVTQVGSFWKLGERIRLTGYAGFYNWHLADPVRAAQAASPPTLTGSTNSNTVAPGNRFASKFAVLNLIGRADVDTGFARWPLMLQLDFTNNTRPCTNFFVATCNPRDRSGWWAEAQVGKTVEKNDINFGYTFIRIEREAVLAAFNFSDLVSPTNAVTHRFNFGYQAFKNITLNYTLLVGRQLRTATSPNEDPWLKRMQFDVVYKF